MSTKKEQNYFSRAGITKSEIFEPDATQAIKDCPSLYTYLKVFYGIVQDRGRVHMVTESRKELFDYIHGHWMQDTPVVHAVNALVGEPDAEPGLCSCAS